jgi:adenylate kinase
MNIIILGPQGSGKGTQAKLLAKKLGLKHISTGQLLRDVAQSGSKKGNIIARILKTGVLMPFETIVEVLEPELKNSESGFILDGTPRNARQADYLDLFFDENNIVIDYVILIDIPKATSIERLRKRFEVEHRTDDNRKAIEERLALYNEHTPQIIEKYQNQGKLIVVDGTPDIDTIHQDIIKKLSLKND